MGRKVEPENDRDGLIASIVLGGNNNGRIEQPKPQSRAFCTLVSIKIFKWTIYTIERNYASEGE
jgi:hypothetical protein